MCGQVHGDRWSMGGASGALGQLRWTCSPHQLGPDKEGCTVVWLKGINTPIIKTGSTKCARISVSR